MSIHCGQVRLFVFALDTLNAMAKNVKRTSLGSESMMFFLLLYTFFVLIKCCTLNIYYFDLRLFL